MGKINIFTYGEDDIVLTGLCNNDALYKFKGMTSIHIYKCTTHVTKQLQLPECVECLCQSHELLGEKLNVKTNPPTGTDSHSNK